MAKPVTKSLRGGMVCRDDCEHAKKVFRSRSKLCLLIEPIHNHEIETADALQKRADIEDSLLGPGCVRAGPLRRDVQPPQWMSLYAQSGSGVSHNRNLRESRRAMNVWAEPRQ